MSCCLRSCIFFFFFFQAEDGIRDKLVTGVQTCALPICRLAHELAAGVLRRRAQLDRTLPLSTADPRLHDILRLGAYQLRALDRVPAYAAVSTSVALARETAGEAAAGVVNQTLRKLPRRLPGFAGGAFIVQDPAHALVCRYAP